MHSKYALNLVLADVSFICDLTKKVCNSCVQDFSIIMNFKVSINPPKAPMIIEVMIIEVH